MKYKVVVSDNRHGDYSIEQGILNQNNIALTILNCVTEDDMIKNCLHTDGILLDMAPLTRRVVQALEKCKVVARYGVGYDNVDVDACTEKGILVTNVPDYCAYDVSDMALALLLDCQRQIAARDRKIRQGKWNIKFNHSYRIKEKVLSVIGFGKISRALIKKVSGFELKEILVCDPFVDEETIISAGARKVSFEEALAEGDYISIHMPVTKETRGIIDDKAFELMKPSAILINTSRGALIEDGAIIDALKNNKIAYAGLDTHNIEPIPKNSEFLKLDNCVLTDHSGYNTHEAVIELKTKAANNIVDVLCGRAPQYPVNKVF